MKSHILLAAFLAAGLSGCGGKSGAPPTDSTIAQDGGVTAGASGTDAGGTAMQAGKSIADNIATSPSHTTLARAMRAAGLSQSWTGTGPFTLFAPSDAAFIQVPPVTLEGWMRPAQKPVLASILNYHAVPGKLTAADLAAQVGEAGGKAVLKTVDGQDLTLSLSGDKLLLTSASGNKATVTQADLEQSNGVVHSVDAVLLPKM